MAMTLGRGGFDSVTLWVGQGLTAMTLWVGQGLTAAGGGGCERQFMCQFM